MRDVPKLNNQGGPGVPGCRAYDAAMVLAHQGGWDEMLFVLIPLLLFAGLLFIANKKAKAHLEAEEAEEPAED